MLFKNLKVYMSCRIQIFFGIFENFANSIEKFNFLASTVLELLEFQGVLMKSWRRDNYNQNTVYMLPDLFLFGNLLFYYILQ